MKIKHISLYFVLVVLFAAPVHADIYTWTGDDGVLYFSDQPGSPDAKLYIKAGPEPARQEIPPAKIKIEPIENNGLAEKLEDANARLNEALDRVETLTEQVEYAESKAAVAAEDSEAAQKAADRAAESANDSNRNTRVVYYGTPYYYKGGHKHRLSKRHQRGSHQKDLKGSFRYGNRRSGTSIKQKHRMKGQPYRKHYGRASANKHKTTRHYRHKGNHRPKNLTDRIINNR